MFANMGFGGKTNDGTKSLPGEREREIKRERLPIVNAVNGEPPPRLTPPNSCSAEARSGTTGSLSLCEGRSRDMGAQSVAVLAATLARNMLVKERSLAIRQA